MTTSTVTPVTVPELEDPTTAAISVILDLAESFGTDQYVGSRRLVSPLLLDAWNDALPAGPKALLENCITSLTARDLAMPSELRDLATAMAAA